MEFQSLSAFKMVADLGSFSRAAEKLFLTQPAISKRIATLENQLSLKLFDRIGKLVSLTEAGELLYPKATLILEEIEESRRLLANLNSRIDGRLRFATSHHIGLHRLPEILRHFKQQHPEVQLDLEFNDSELAFDQVIRGELAFAVVTLPPVVPEKLQAIPIWRDELVLVMGKRTEGKSPKDALSAQGAILPPQNTVTRSIIEKELKAQGIEFHIAMESHYLETIKKMVEIDLGWSALPATMLDDNLQTVQIPGLHMRRELGVIRHKDRTLSNAARAMLELLQAA